MRAQLIVLNSSSIPGMDGPQVYTLKIDLHVIVYCSLVLAMTQVCGLEATIEGMKVTSQRRLTISKPVSPNVVFVCKADQLVLRLGFIYNFLIFGCESSPISPNVRSSVSQSVSQCVRQMQNKAK